MKRITGIQILLAALTLGLASTAAIAQEGGHEFVGSKNCRKCHLKQYKSWETTKMAMAFEVLRPGEAADAKTAAGLDPAKDYTTDEACIGCHVTGFGKPGGFVSEAETPELVGVGCEMCHGAGGTYTQDEYMSLKNKEYKKADIVAAGMVAEVTEEQCLTCHNSDSPTVTEGEVFDFEANVEKGTHEHFELKYSH